MIKPKLLLFVVIYFLSQGCNSTISTRTNTLSTSEPLMPAVTQTLLTPTQTPSVEIASSTPSPGPISLEGLEIINPSNVFSLVNLVEIQSHNHYAISLYWAINSEKIHVLKSNGSIEIWDIQHRSLVKTFESANQNSYSIGWNPAKNLVAYVDKTTNEVFVWDLENNKFLFNLGMYTTYPFISVSNVSWSPNGTSIISTGWDDTLRVWDAITGAQIKVIESKSLWYESVAWSPKGDFIAVGHKSGTVYLIRTDTWEIVHELYGHNSGHEGGVPSIAWSPDGTKIASGGRDEKKAFIWDLSGIRLHELNDEPLSVFDLDWSPDSKMIAASGEGRNVIITDALTGVELFKLGNHKPNTYCVAWSPNGKLLATMTAEGSLRIWGVRK